MTAGGSTRTECSVINGEKLPPETGGPLSICESVKGALKDQGGHPAVRVEIHVKSNSWLVARITSDGRTIPDQNIAVADGKLRKASIDRFARAIAQAVAASS